jgi:hypothetical protein
MQFKKNTQAPNLRILAIPLALSLAAFVGTLAARTPTTVNHVGTLTAANPPQDSGCKAVLDASEKLFSIPYHSYTTITMNGKPTPGETISVGGVIYVMYNGKWSSGMMTLEEMKQQNEINKKKLHNVSCKYVRDESVNGESAAVYSTHEETEHGKNDNQMWISKSKGLILKQETDIDIGNGRPISHFSGRYEYTNVQAPAVTK